MSDNKDSFKNAYNYILLLEYILANKGVEITVRKKKDDTTEVAWIMQDGTVYLSPYLDILPYEVLLECFEVDAVADILERIRMEITEDDITDIWE